VRENVRLAIQAREAGAAPARLTCGVWSDPQGWIERAHGSWRPGAPGRQGDRPRQQPAAWRPAQAGGGLLIALDPKVFMFDEPTAGMSVDEVPVVLDLIRA
jgi:branched-chain amino acid transport system ATP-binding protein